MRTAAFMILGVMVVGSVTVKSRIRPTPSPIVMMEFVRPFQEPRFLLTALASFMFMLGAFLPFNFITLQAEHEGMSSHLADYLISILNAVR